MTISDALEYNRILYDRIVALGQVPVVQDLQASEAGNLLLEQLCQSIGGAGGSFSRYTVHRQHNLNMGNGKPKNHFYFPLQHDPALQAFMSEDWNGKNIPATGAALTQDLANPPFMGASGIRGWSTSQFFLDSTGLLGTFPLLKPLSFTAAHLLYWPGAATATGSSFIIFSEVNNYRMDIRPNAAAGGVNVHGELLMNQQNYFFGAQLLGLSNSARASAVLSPNKWHIVSYAYDAAVGYARMRCQPLDASPASWGDHQPAVPGPQPGKAIQIRFGKNAGGWLDPAAICADAFFANGDCLGNFLDQTPLPGAIGDLANNNWNTFEIGNFAYGVSGGFASSFANTNKYSLQTIPGELGIGPAFVGPIGTNGVVTAPDANIISNVTPKTRNLIDGSIQATWFQYALTGNPGSTYFDVLWNGITTRVFVDVTVS